MALRLLVGLLYLIFLIYWFLLGLNFWSVAGGGPTVAGRGRCSFSRVEMVDRAFHPKLGLLWLAWIEPDIPAAIRGSTRGGAEALTCHEQRALCDDLSTQQ
jgi:hypothetical protein